MTTNTQPEIESIEVGDQLAWTEDWTGGQKQCRATVTEHGTTKLGSPLAGDAREIQHFELDVHEGPDRSKITEEEIADAVNFVHTPQDDL